MCRLWISDCVARIKEAHIDVRIMRSAWNHFTRFWPTNWLRQSERLRTIVQSFPRFSDSKWVRKLNKLIERDKDRVITPSNDRHVTIHTPNQNRQWTIHPNNQRLIGSGSNQSVTSSGSNTYELPNGDIIYIDETYQQQGGRWRVWHKIILFVCIVTFITCFSTRWYFILCFTHCTKWS